MVGTKLALALEWFNRAVKCESENKTSMMDRCIEKMLSLEREGIAAGESWD